MKNTERIFRRLSIIKRLFGSKLSSKFNDTPLKMIILGLDRAGKTSFVEWLKLGEFTNPRRTLGLNIEEVKVENLYLKIMDLGGQGPWRHSLWPKLIKDAEVDVILYVLDATDEARLMITSEEFFKLLEHPKLLENKTPIVVLANKQDLPNHLSSGEIAVELKLVEYSLSGRSFQVFPTSMKTGDGIKQVLAYLQKLLERKMQIN